MELSLKQRGLLTLATGLLPCSVFGAPLVIHSGNLRELVETRSAVVRAATAETEAAKEREGHLGRSFLPSVRLHAGAEEFEVGREGRRNQPVYGAEVAVNLYNGGRDRTLGLENALETGRRTADHRTEVSRTLEDVRRLYWEILFLQEKSKALESSLQLNEKNLQAAQRRIQSGVATDSDRFEFEMRAVDLKREKARLVIELASAKSELGVLLAMEPREEPRFEESLGHDHDYEKVLVATEADSAFVYRGEELAAEKAALASASAKRELLPRLEAYAAYNQFNEREKEFAEVRDRTESVVGLRLELNVESGFEALRESRARGREAEALRLRAGQLKRGTASFLATKRAELKMLHDQVHEAEENIRRAERYYKMTQSEYVRGVKNSPDVLGAAEKLFEREQRHLEIVRDFQIVKAQILAKLGR